jgi:Ca2+-binding RTX toxin-like protein
VAGPSVIDGDFTIDVDVVDNPLFGYWCAGQRATIIGTTGDDTPLNGTSGDDVIVGLDGDDYIYGLGGNDIICGDGALDQLDEQLAADDHLHQTDRDITDTRQQCVVSTLGQSAPIGDAGL